MAAKGFRSLVLLVLLASTFALVPVLAADSAPTSSSTASDKTVIPIKGKTTASTTTVPSTTPSTTSTTATSTPNPSSKPSPTTTATSSSSKTTAPNPSPTPSPIPSPKPKKVVKPTIVNKVVDFAPAAEVKNGDDVDPEGPCEADVEKLCDDVEFGEGKVAECLSDAIAEYDSPDSDSTPPSISDECREHVYRYKIDRDSNINKNIPLAKACKDDAVKLCNVTWFFGYKAGQVIGCLRDISNRDALSKKCLAEVKKVMADAAEDIRADVSLSDACKEDLETLCKDVPSGGGRKQACLREQRLKLSWNCEEQLFRQEVENADDIRLSVKLFRACLPDKRKFCKEIEPGSARVKDCLEEHRPRLSSGCAEEVNGMIERRVRNLSLDSRLRRVCQDDIYNTCLFFGDFEEMDGQDSNIINCLQDYVDDMKSDDCKSMVKKYQELASQDIRFNVPLADACGEDRKKFCFGVPAGDARVIRCLTSSRDKLSPICRATLFDEEVRFSENIDFQLPMKAACTRELDRFCKDVPHGNARAIRCLQDHKSDKDVTTGCLKEIKAYEATINKDYRLNTRLSKSCAKDISSLCNGICATDGQVCGGKVLRCLQDNQDDIQDKSCKAEVFYFEKMEVDDFNNDILLAEACRADVDKFCASVESGNGRVHQCLRKNRAKLSPQCKAEEMRLEEVEEENVELNVGLIQGCKAERQLFCRDVSAGQARIFRCLAENVNDADFGSVCKDIIMTKLRRRQANWKLDPPLRKACKADVSKKCNRENLENSEQGVVYKCLARNYDGIADGCATELGRAVHMAFFSWDKDQPITKDCDDDIQRLCISARPNIASRPGAVGACLANVLERMERVGSRSLATTTSTNDTARPGRLSDACAMMAYIAEPPNMKEAFDTSLTFAMVKSQLEGVESLTGLNTLAKTRGGEVRGITLTGWMALAGMFAFAVLIVFGAYKGYQQYKGASDKDYTLVVKGSAQEKQSLVR